MAIIAADGFKFSKTNTPTREGERIATIAEITNREKVPNPSVGMLIFVEDERAHYVVLELGGDKIGGIEVPNVVVKKYEKVEVKDGSISKKKLSREVQDEFETLNSQIAALSAGLTASLTSSPNVVHKGIETDVTLTASLNNNAGAVKANNIHIKKDDDNVLAENTGESSLRKLLRNFTASSDTDFIADIGINGMTLTAKTTVAARNPVYAGMGTSAEEVANNDSNKQSARTSARGYTYTKIATADGQYFFLLIPSDVTKPTTFTMGGAPFAMEAGTTETINGISYTVYRSSELYNTGAEVNVTAN